jgi:perosamine synthetase
MMDKDFGVGCCIANKPVYLSRKLLRDHTPGQSCPLSEVIGERLFCVSLHPAMTEEDNEYAAASLIECVERLR